MKDYYFYTTEDNGKRLVAATSKAYFDAHGKPDEAGTDDYVEFYRAIASEGFTEIFPPLYKNTKPVPMPTLLDAMARKGIRLCRSKNFDKAAMRLVLEGPSI